jgi:hypothetical protein
MSNKLFKYQCLTGSLDSISRELNEITKYSQNIKSFSKIAGIDQYNRPVISIVIKIYFDSKSQLEYYENRNNNNNIISGIN